MGSMQDNLRLSKPREYETKTCLGVRTCCRVCAVQIAVRQLMLVRSSIVLVYQGAVRGVLHGEADAPAIWMTDFQAIIESEGFGSALVVCSCSRLLWGAGQTVRHLHLDAGR